MAKPSGTKKSYSTREYGLPYSKSWSRANYAYPRGAGKDRGKRPSYPIVPKARARAARTYAARRDTAGSLAGVDRAIRARYGSVNAIYAGRSGRSGGRSASRRGGRR